MKERINRLARGIVDAELPKPVISPARVEETLSNHTIYKRELFVSSGNNLYIKGLAYSSHPRVRILTAAFGGLRNHIAYEIDTSWCENGDMIEGSVSLVTNGGEFEVPFLFLVEMTGSVRVLTTLKTVEDYAGLAQKDMEMALRLMEYRDFTEAPFLQDMHVRAVYEGLRGHGNRQNALEEFFLALGVKEPVELTLSTARKSYENLTDVISDKVVLKKNTWGYLSIEVRADGEFIELSKKMITQSDFEDGRFELRFKIHPERMHKGKNLGAICLMTVHGDTRISIEAMGDTTVDITGREHEISKAGICRYLKLREAYESAGDSKAELLSKIQKELDAIRGAHGSSLLLTLLQAETSLEAGRADQASLSLDECRDELLAVRDRFGTLYCYYQYLQYRTAPDEEKKESLLRLLRKKTDGRRKRFYLYLLLLKLEPELFHEEEALYETFKSQFDSGCCSPFLYIEALKLFEQNPDLIRSVDDFELHVLLYGARHGTVGKELAGKIAALASGAKFFHQIYYRILSSLYEQYPSKELLGAVCGLLIKGNCRSKDCFLWYQKAVEEEISLTRLYEYYLYSLPEQYDTMLPRQVLLYFSYEHSQLDRKSRAALYQNILLHLDSQDALYRTYEREMEKFTMEQLFQSRISSQLAVIYKHMIYRDIIDEQVAKVLPAVLRSSCITCADSAMKYVVVCNEMMTGEDAYPLNGGVAYVPLFFEDSVILFQDAFGNRYMDVSYTREQALAEKDLEERCFEMYPQHPMLRMRACIQIMEQEELSSDDVLVLQHALEELPLKPLYQQKMLTKIITFYRSQIDGKDSATAEEGSAYLLRLNKKELTREERADVCETLISQNHVREGYRIIKDFGAEEVKIEQIAGLLSRLLGQKGYDGDPLLLSLAQQVFEAGQGDKKILDFLCRCFNGTNRQMYRILVRAVRARVETYDLEERLLAQLLFTGNAQYLDRVFDFYAKRKKTGELLVKAYFTVKCVGYFLRDEVPGDRVFAYLESAVGQSGDLRKVPEIYLMALTKFYSGIPTLEEEQKTLCGRLVELLLEQGMVFSYFKNLAETAEIPGDILDKEIIEYHGSASKRPVLMVRVLPDDEEFHEEEMRMIYKGIYVRQKVLFEGEIMEYEVYEADEDNELIKMASGDIACTEAPAGDKQSRFSCLNSMNLYLGIKDDEKLRESMVKYVTDDLTVERLFPLA